MSLLAALMPMIHSRGSQPRNGLLDAFSNPLTQMGLGLLASGGPSLTPNNPMSGLMAGLQSSVQLRQQEQENALRNQQVSAQLAHYDRQAQKDADATAKEAEKKAAVDAWIQSLPPGTPPDLIRMAEANPDLVMEYVMKGQMGDGRSQSDDQFWASIAQDPQHPLHEQGKAIIGKMGAIGGASGGQFSGAPTYYRDKAGNLRIGQLNKFGGMIDATTGRPVDPNDVASVVPPAYDPTLQGAVAAAKTGAEAEAKRDFGMTGIGDIIDEARTALSGKDKDGNPIPGWTPPTSSGIGAMADAAGAAFGMNVEGAAQADQLSAIGGALVAKMPRMEGPQSEFDVQNYQRMAGEVGNKSLPLARRLAALDAVERLWRKYDPAAKPNMLPSQNMTPTGSGTVLRFDAQGNMIQ